MFSSWWWNTTPHHDINTSTLCASLECFLDMCNCVTHCSIWWNKIKAFSLFKKWNVNLRNYPFSQGLFGFPKPFLTIASTGLSWDFSILETFCALFYFIWYIFNVLLYPFLFCIKLFSLWHKRVFISKAVVYFVKVLRKKMTLNHKTSHNNMGIFVAIANNTSIVSKLK